MKTLRIISVLMTIVLSFSVIGSGDHDAPPNAHGAAQLVGEGEFTLNEKSEKRLGLKWQKLEKNGPWVVPREAIVKVKFTNGVYRKFEGILTLVVLESLKVDGPNVIIQSADLAAGDEVAIKGVKYIRLAEVDISSEPAGHSH